MRKPRNKTTASKFAETADELIERHNAALRAKLNPVQEGLAKLILNDVGSYRPGSTVTRTIGEQLIDIANHFDHWGRTEEQDGSLHYEAA